MKTSSITPHSKGFRFPPENYQPRSREKKEEVIIARASMAKEEYFLRDLEPTGNTSDGGFMNETVEQEEPVSTSDTRQKRLLSTPGRAYHSIHRHLVPP
jgi:hypothetical protein